MDTIYYIILGVGIGVVGIVATIIYLTKHKKKVQNPLISRSENMVVMINQKILSINSRIEKLDREITALLASKEKGELSLLEKEITLDKIPEKIDKNKEEINTYIADIKDLRDYKDEIESILRVKGDKDWKKLEELLDFIKEKFQYRYI